MTQVIHCIACLDEGGVEIVYSTHSSADHILLVARVFQFDLT